MEQHPGNCASVDPRISCYLSMALCRHTAQSVSPAGGAGGNVARWGANVLLFAWAEANDDGQGQSSDLAIGLIRSPQYATDESVNG